MMRREDYRQVYALLELALEEAEAGKSNGVTIEMAIKALDRQQIHKPKAIALARQEESLDAPGK